MIFFDGNIMEEAKTSYEVFSKTSFFDFLKKNKNIINENGLNRIYYNEGKGDLFEEFHMKNGKKNGLYVQYYPKKNGIRIRKQVVNFNDNLADGLYTQYWDGPMGLEWKMYEINYRNGLMDGSYTKYASYINCMWKNNGEKYTHAEFNYKSGKKHGWCTFYLLSKPNEIGNKIKYNEGEEIERLDDNF